MEGKIGKQVSIRVSIHVPAGSAAALLAALAGALVTGALVIGPMLGNEPSPKAGAKRQGMKPYLEMPSAYPLTPGQWAAVPAFPHLKFTAPTFLTHAPGSRLLYVLEREGVIKAFDNDPKTRRTTVVLDLQSRCQGRQDSGLLGLAFHPDWGKTGAAGRGWFFICYNYSPEPIRAPEHAPEATPSRVRLSRFTVPDGQLAADPASELVLIEQEDEHLFHTGGAMFFHPDDGFLYVAFGDEGTYGGRLGNCQRIDRDLFGGVIRIDVDNEPARSHPPPRQPKTGKTAHYGIPNDNPFVGMPGVLEEFYALGLRSPHRMTIDPVTKQIWLGDVGDGGVDPREEINLIVRGGNYQWNYKEGTQDRPVYAHKPARLIGAEQPPLHDYPHAAGDGCVIGGFVYRGQEHHDQLAGRYVFGDYNSGRVWSLEERPGQAPVVTPLCTLPPKACRLTSFGVDHAGELLLCTMEGKILKLARAGTPALPLNNARPFPPLLSQTGAFADVRSLTPNPGVLPYDVNCPLWSDYSEKQRWIVLPRGAIRFSATGPWRFPPGTVFIKHFELPIDESDARVRRRLETRLLVIAEDRSAYGVTYRWRSDESDAELLDGAFQETVRVKTAGGEREQVWTYPSRADCMVCHNATADWVLGVNARQLNRPCADRPGENQLERWRRLQMFQQPPSAEDLAQCGRLFALDDERASVQDRARSYLDANCAYCHNPEHLQQLFDARFDTPLALQRLVDVPAFRTSHGAASVLIQPGAREQSLLYQRLTASGTHKMPPLGRSIADPAAAAVIGAWIDDIARARWRWCMQGLALGVLSLGVGGALTAWLQARVAKSARRPWMVRTCAALPLTVVVSASIVLPLLTREQGSAATLLAGIHAALGVAVILGLFWARRSKRGEDTTAALASNAPRRHAA